MLDFLLRFLATISVGIYGQEYIDGGYVVNRVYISVVLYIKKELPVSEYKDRSYMVIYRRRVVVVSLISHPYSN